MKTFLKNLGIIFGTMLLIVSCSDDNENDNVEKESYQTTIKITDAPIDNANVEAVFITVSDVKVDGNSIEGFTKTTFNLSALVNGQTKTLGNLPMEAGTYSNIELVLDYANDMDGNSPGCYVEMVDGTKDKIEASSSTVNITDSFEVFATNTNEIIIDFDLRKTIKEEQGTLESDFDFVTLSELSAGIRTVNKEATGEISGTVNDSQDTSDKIVVYAYEKGTYSAEVETQGQGESNIRFANAVTSAEVSGINNAYSLNFLAEGEYELIFVSYTQDGAEFYFNSQLEVESTTGLDLGAINITSALQLSANVTVTGTTSL
ncbi:DUF4382 domain-containing protein [Muricauda ruestringensis]|uniref:DUF4382 domain-containing protein n=1 Tax=Flagellimonas aurea TaxID=2915619 RepID=A0ABS3GA29_9FLAO|nr:MULTISPECIES: DUF4382 domain-containing protein [Allomuricauda]MAO16598.1 hypothetical protein [Allomuricauda sp.]MBC72533.1 hypothetical protein [Allomuricauda sp.]MBO0356271.1 DUF4382 domain-containing protein [Allomuricauda aurea]|tara:strand:+ start:2047 stop:3000 length:954 start_codon:yes stop_codon:yes gene_type:complete